MTVDAGKSVTIKGLTLTKGVNSGVTNSGTATIQDSAVSGNTGGFGGGITNNGTLTGLRSAVSGNTASGEGAGLYIPAGTVTVVDSTIANNVTGPSGDGGSAVMNQASLTVVNSTITGNTLTTSLPVTGFTGGIYSTSSTSGVTVKLSNTIIAGNTFTDNNNNTSESDFVDQSGGASGTYTDGAIGGSHTGSDADNIVGLSYNGRTYTPAGILATGTDGKPALADNGGPTRTVATAAHSPAVGHGDTATCQTAPVNGVDQRGAARPTSFCAIGAYEPTPKGKPST